MNKINDEVKKQDETKLRFPSNLIYPIGRMLGMKMLSLKRKRDVISQEDPFKDTDRLMDNASPDTDAAEQFGHAKTVAIKNELNGKIVQIKKALKRIKTGKYGICEDCGKMIDTDRLGIYPEATYCISCEKKREK